MCWSSQHFPTPWKRAAISLIYKKGDPAKPENFRPIALQPVLGKVFSSCIRNKIWTFVEENKLVDTSIQKGFWPGVAGTTEHIHRLQYLMNDQHKHNRSIYIVLLDLKNAFGEVHHSLIRSTLADHHIPSNVINLIMNQYTGFFTSIMSSARGDLSTPILVRRGVLQGDTLSPLLFNLAFNSLMLSLKQPELNSLGILWGNGSVRSLWSQFADDAAITCDSLKSAQHLINLFQRWTLWADFTIRPDKCICYGAAKVNGRYQQILPSLSVNGIKIDPVPLQSSFTYLGHQFSFARNVESARVKLLELTRDSITTADNLPITPLLKCSSLNLLLRAKLSFVLRHVNVGHTWLTQSLDTLVTNKVRTWLGMPPCATAHYVPLPKSKLGLEIVLPSLLAEQCRTAASLSLQTSNDPDTVTLSSLLHLTQPATATSSSSEAAV